MLNIIDTKPELFFRPQTSIWIDPYIQQNLLCAHLNPDTDAASRNPQSIKKTVEFICSHATAHNHILDLGCGPGLYAQQFIQQKHTVTGVDFNQAAIEYACNHIPEAKWIQSDYIKNFPVGNYDLITLIYCDLGTHSDHNRDILLKNCFQSLNTGGKLIFDIFNEQIQEDRKEEKTWEYNPEAGFWSPKSHLLLKQTFHYPQQKAYADQYNLITEEEVKHFVLWERYYSEQEIKEILLNIGFQKIHITKNLLTRNNFTSSHEMFIVAEK